MKKTTTTLLVLLLTFLQGILAQPGTLDISFGNNGSVITSIGEKDQVQNIKVQKDRKILVLGSIDDSNAYDIILTRYLSDGALDNGFGVNGVVKTKLSTANVSEFSGLFFQLDQKILITGKTSSNQAVVVRYLPDGTLDTSFGDRNDGTISLSLPNPVNDVIMQPDGKLLVANITDRAIVVTRFNPDGTLDVSYGDDGTASTFPSETRQSRNFFSKMLLTTNNDLLIVSTHGAGGLGQFFLFYRALAFNADGKTISGYSELNDNDFTADAALDNESNLFITTRKGHVFKLDTNLDLDQSFGENGFLLESSNNKIAVDNENNIITSSNDATTGAVYLKKYNNDGLPDMSFGTNGTVNIPDNTKISTIEIPKNGKILVGGTTATSTNDTEGTDSILLRYNGSSSVEEESPITCFTLINAKTNMTMLSLEDGKSYSVNNIMMSSLNIEANIASNQKFKSYALRLEGPVSFSRTESAAPYAVFGDLAGNYLGKTLLEGSYTIEAIPYTELYAKGESGIPLKVSFELIDTSSKIENFTLIATNTGNPISGIREGDVITLDGKLSYSIIANANPKTQGSVALELSGPALNVNKIENQIPYAIFGDTNGKFNGRRFSEGDYTISATPFSKRSGTGIAGETLTTNFSIKFYTKSIIVPNPIVGEVAEIFFGDRIPPMGAFITYAVYDPVGRKIVEGSFTTSSFSYTIDLRGKLTDRGIYMLQFGPETLQFVY